MLVKNPRRLALLFMVPLIFITTCIVLFQHSPSSASGQTGLWTADLLKTDSTNSEGSADQDQVSFLSFGKHGKLQHELSEKYVEVFSASTKNKQYFLVDFGGEEAINPSIIPHPAKPETWIIVAQQLRAKDVDKSIWFSELVCEAKFKKGKLSCTKPPRNLPIAVTAGDKCVGDLSYFAFSIGPHDARVFYGPSSPLVVFGSNSGYTCFGQWIQDFRVLVDWHYETISGAPFRLATELQRPPPMGLIEKNWFVFWDKGGEAYVHYDAWPNRAYAKLDRDGSVNGGDMAHMARYSDEKCMQRFMPKVAESLESIHQATNSLAITLCKRSDLGCEPNDENTYIMTIIQHKSYYSFHSVYEPYVILFKRTAPFELHAISSKPIWIHGRGKPGEKRPKGPEFESLDSWDQTEMFYVTSMSWKSQGQKYHGYSDDVVFINFGIEDSKAASIDVVAGDLLKDIGLCSSS
ncbi:hypothetical protein PV08_03761 [Exophiala spinifera]|uniref:Uncharacterized protein n=1 Tax=Exophiala spinifera TaxID=91928 RepID=A0A0D2BC86_9EURO|nr:uncharacterized protein PV08_03761 [Exophiala spinifera]KIW16573.1 hypothetical protein PV08_03761 [Exophiala spinifera]